MADFPRSMLTDMSQRLRISLRANLRLWGARGIRFIQRFCCFLPLVRNKLTVYLHARRGYGCNLKYIVEALLKAYPDVQIVWVTAYPEAVASLQQRGIRVVKLNALRHWWHQFTSKAILISDALPATVRLRRGQVLANAWHGGMNYKHIGPKYCVFEHPAQRKNFHAANPQPHHYFSGSRFFTEDVCASFDFSPEVFHPFGMARNDLFFKDMRPIYDAIRRQYGLASTDKIVLYAPTFREDKLANGFALDVERLLWAIGKRFGGTWKFLYRAHYFITETTAFKDAIDVSAYEDMSELLAASDALITDYSSCLWDFALTKRPSFIYATDLEAYCEHERAFALPPEQWPCPICTTNDALERQILSFDLEQHRQRLDAHLAACGSYDDGHAAERAAAVLHAALMA